MGVYTQLIKEQVLLEAGIELNKVEVPENIKEDAEIVVKELGKLLDIMRKDTEYKNAIAKLSAEKSVLSSKEKSVLSGDLKTYIKQQVIDIYPPKDFPEGKVKRYEINWQPPISQDAFYYEYEQGKHLYNVTDKYFKALKDNKKINYLSSYSGTYNGDDFLDFTVELKN